MSRLLAFLVLVLSLGSFVYVEKQAHAQALQLIKPFTGTVNKAVASTLGKRLNNLGFAVNDPIYGATLATASTVVNGAVATGSVAATVAAVGTAPAWLSVALGLGAAYEIYDFTMGSKTFKAQPSNLINVASGTVNVQAAQPAVIPQTEIVTPPPLATDYANPGVGNAIVYPSDAPICATISMSGVTSPITGVDATMVSFKTATVCGATQQALRDLAYNQYAYVAINSYNGADTMGQFWLQSFTNYGSSGPTKTACTINALTCPQGIQYAYTEQKTVNIKRQSLTYPGDPPTFTNTVNTFNYYIFNNPHYLNPGKMYSVNDAASTLVDSDLTQRADPALLAALANKIWQQAAQQPGYSGAPYNPLNPVTESDVLADIAAGLYPHPTVSDLLSLTSPNTSTAVVLDPASVPIEAPATSTAQVDLGPDPGTASPTLEATPTGSTVVGHVMGLLPSLSAFTIPAHVSACEGSTFDFFGHVMTIDPGCNLIEGQRALLSTLFSAIWGISALFIVLRA